jgi:hypothetical protein
MNAAKGGTMLVVSTKWWWNFAAKESRGECIKAVHSGSPQIHGGVEKGGRNAAKGERKTGPRLKCVQEERSYKGKTYIP